MGYFQYSVHNIFSFKKATDINGDNSCDVNGIPHAYICYVKCALLQHSNHAVYTEHISVVIIVGENILSDYNNMRMSTNFILSSALASQYHRRLTSLGGKKSVWEQIPPSCIQPEVHSRSPEWFNVRPSPERYWPGTESQEAGGASLSVSLP